MRLNILITSLRDRIRTLRTASELTHHAIPPRAQIDAAISAPPLHGDGSSALTVDQADALRALLTALESAEQAFASSDIVQPYRPVPEPLLRVRAPLQRVASWRALVRPISCCGTGARKEKSPASA